MQIGFLSTKNPYGFLHRIEKLLVRKGHELVCALYLDSDADFAEALNYTAAQSQAIIYYGDRDKLFGILGKEYHVDPTLSAFELNETLYAVMDEFSDEFINENVIHLLNSRCKVFYTTEIFKTFGKTEEQIRERLKKYIKNRSRVSFSIYPSLCECEVDIRYSNKMQHAVVNELLSGVRESLADCTYAYSDTDLASEIVRLLGASGKTVCVAESFTGGAIGSAITLCSGASKVLREDMVCYTNESKTDVLGVKKEIIDEYGAVSVQTVYEMAVKMLLRTGCDISLATSGNAGPTSEKENDVGHCFIAIGSSDGVHIFEHNFSGDRKTVTECGVKYSLYYLFRKLIGKLTDNADSVKSANNQDNKE